MRPRPRDLPVSGGGSAGSNPAGGTTLDLHVSLRVTDMNRFWRALVECLVERTHSTNRYTPRTPARATTGPTSMTTAKALVIALHLVDCW